MTEEIVQELWIEIILKAQDEEKWIVDLKAFPNGDLEKLSQNEANDCVKIASSYEIDENDLLFYYSQADQAEADLDRSARLVIPETLQADILHHYHVRLEGGHQGVGRTYHRIHKHFHWRGLYRSDQKFVGTYTDCETGKGMPNIQGRSPENIQATYPFQVIAMDHIPSLPKSFKDNTELLIWTNLFTGLVIAKAGSARTVQQVACSYEECVFRRFGASEVIRHDREPGFMTEVFRSFNQMLGQKQSATMAYRPQANGKVERMVQTLTRTIKMYVADSAQQDWDE